MSTAASTLAELYGRLWAGWTRWDTIDRRVWVALVVALVVVWVVSMVEHNETEDEWDRFMEAQSCAANSDRVM